MSIIAATKRDYKDGRTKQSFRDETDVNAIIRKHTRMDTLSHLEQWGGQYGDLASFDFQTAQNQIAKANSMFEELPAAIRQEFKNSPERFIDFVNHPDNKDDLAKKLPELAEPGSIRQNLHPSADNPPEPDPAPPAPEPAPTG